MESPSNGTALVAVCQMNSTNDVDRNLGICEDLVRKAKSRGAKVRFLCSHMSRGGGRGVLAEQLGRMCGPLPKTLTLFMTKICDFPYPIYDLTKNLIPYL